MKLIGILAILYFIGGVLGFLRLLDILRLSWWLVTAPYWIMPLIAVLTFIIFLIIALSDPNLWQD